MQPYMTPVNFSFSWHRITDSTEPNNCSLVRCEQVCLGRSYSHEIRIRIWSTSVVEHFSQNFHRVLLRCRVTDTTAWMPKWLTANGPDSSSRFVLHYTVVLMPNSFQILLTKNIILFTKTINDYHYNDIPISHTSSSAAVHHVFRRPQCLYVQYISLPRLSCLVLLWLLNTRWAT